MSTSLLTECIELPGRGWWQAYLTSLDVLRLCSTRIDQSILVDLKVLSDELGQCWGNAFKVVFKLFIVSLQPLVQLLDCSFKQICRLKLRHDLLVLILLAVNNFGQSVLNLCLSLIGALSIICLLLWLIKPGAVPLDLLLISLLLGQIRHRTRSPRRVEDYVDPAGNLVIDFWVLFNCSICLPDGLALNLD